MSPDGAYFFFTSYKTDRATPEQPLTIDQVISAMDSIDNGLGNIYWLESDFLATMRGGGPPP